MKVTLEVFVQALVDAFNQIAVQISSIATFFVRVDENTVELDANTTLRAGKLIVYDDDGSEVDLYQRLAQLESIWTQSRYGTLKSKIDNTEQKLQKFYYNESDDRLTINALVRCVNLEVSEDLYVGGDLDTQYFSI